MFFLVDMCCLCLNNADKTLHHLSEATSGAMTYYEKILEALPTLIFKSDNYLLCPDCCDTIDSVYEFVIKSVKNFNTLLNYKRLIDCQNDNNYEMNILLTDMEHTFANSKRCVYTDIKTKEQERVSVYLKEEKSDVPFDVTNINQLTSITENYNIIVKQEELDAAIDESDHQFDCSEYNVQECDDLSSKEFSDRGEVDIKEKDLNIKIEEPDIITTYLNNEITSVNVTATSPVAIDIKEENVNINNEESDLVTSYLDSYNIKSVNFTDDSSAATDNMQNKMRDSCSNLQDESLLDPEQVHDICTDLINENDANKYEQQTNISMKKSTNKRTYTHEKFCKCHVVGKSSETSINLIKHEFLHEDRKHYKCDVCNKWCMNSSDLETHKLNPTGKKLHECDVCNKKFMRSSHLKRHKLIHTGERLHECDVCNHKFTQLSSLKIHKLIHTGERLYECDICNKKFMRTSHLASHKLLHTGENLHECDVCNKKFTQAGGLKTHILIHAGEKPYVCNFCNKRFTQSGSLKVHEHIHTNEKPYKCNVCNKRFTDSISLSQHIHIDNKPYECDVCNKRFMRSSHLKRHKLIHTGERLYECDICNKKFMLLSYLSSHKLRHTDEKLHECGICNKKFTRSSSLKTHTLIHTGEKPHVCNVCNKRFTQVGNLRVHELIHMD